jgi:hypothetical protein
VLSLGASEIARCWKLDARADSATQEVKQQWDESSAGERQPERSEKAHGNCWRAANARRSGTPNGASVVMTS